jgi:integrase
MKRKAKQYLEYSSWPAKDKALWKAAFAAGTDLFDESGPGAHLAERTIQQLQYTYGKFLYFLATEHPELLDHAPADRVTKTVSGFVGSQPASCGAITLGIYLYHLWLAMKYLCPKSDWSWLLAISARIKARGKPKPERHHLVTSDRLYRLGLELMDAAVASDKPVTSWRVQTAFRDGLAIALAAAFVPRRRTMAALRIGKQLKKIGDLWFLDIPPEDVKTKRPLEYPISPQLSQRIDIYVDEIRPFIVGAKTHDYLWASARGRPMNGAVIYNAVRSRSRKAFGFPVNLHRFRAAAGTFWSVQDPENVRGVKDLLGHADFATTEKYYIMARSRLAGRALARILAGLRNRRAGQKRPPPNLDLSSVSDGFVVGHRGDRD